ncbi:hypothetical protein INR49_029962 [Caranx melampygus]|nr:hypothetical protein INR49_029962 [Caranx melampygus]
MKSMLCKNQGDHVDQLLVSHAGEQGHHGDLGVGSAQLLTGTQYRGLGTLEQEKHLGKQQNIVVAGRMQNGAESRTRGHKHKRTGGPAAQGLKTAIRGWSVGIQRSRVVAGGGVAVERSRSRGGGGIVIRPFQEVHSGYPSRTPAIFGIPFKQHQVSSLQGRVQVRSISCHVAEFMGLCPERMVVIGPHALFNINRGHYGNTAGRCQDVGSLGVGVQLRPPPVFIHRRPPIPPPGPSLAGSVFPNRERTDSPLRFQNRPMNGSCDCNVKPLTGKHRRTTLSAANEFSVCKEQYKLQRAQRGRTTPGNKQTTATRQTPRN